MKIRTVVALAGLAISFAVSVLAQGTDLVQIYPIGDAICAIWEFFHYTTQTKGYYTAIYVHEGDTWKIRMAYNN